MSTGQQEQGGVRRAAEIQTQQTMRRDVLRRFSATREELLPPDTDEDEETEKGCIAGHEAAGHGRDSSPPPTASSMLDPKTNRLRKIPVNSTAMLSLDAVIANILHEHKVSNSKALTRVELTTLDGVPQLQAQLSEGLMSITKQKSADVEVSWIACAPASSTSNESRPGAVTQANNRAADATAKLNKYREHFKSKSKAFDNVERPRHSLKSTSDRGRARDRTPPTRQRSSISRELELLGRRGTRHAHQPAWRARVREYTHFTTRTSNTHLIHRSITTDSSMTQGVNSDRSIPDPPRYSGKYDDLYPWLQKVELKLANTTFRSKLDGLHYVQLFFEGTAWALASNRVP
ncbi:hypothetical protein LTR08_001650 [Meristemomyces frigidus]|nr:hypothetical protein LTR08_001650 [Meristemomyces frigidus]